MKSIARKIVLLSLAIVVLLGGSLGTAFIVAVRSDSEAEAASYSGELRSSFDSIVKSEVEIAISLLKGVQAEIESGALKAEAGHRLGAALLRGLAYGSDGYFWADTYRGDNVVYLGADAEGKNRMNAKDVKGDKYVKSFIQRAQARGGYTDYYLPKKSGARPSTSAATPPLSSPLVGSSARGHTRTLSMLWYLLRRRYWPLPFWPGSPRSF
jgi:methyl-accepting chemotaxis protein